MIQIKSAAEIDKMRASGALCARCMDEVISRVRPGVTTLELDIVAEQFIKDSGAIASFKGYRGFPKSVCISVNDEVVHGIPASRMIKDGDIVGLDLGVLLDGYHSDMARTVPAGEISQEAARLIAATKECFYAGMEKAVAGNRLNDISTAIEQKAFSYGYSVVHELVGHGIGKNLHEQPDVPNYSFRGPNPRLKAGMVICIEPMVNTGERFVKWGSDGWLVSTQDGSLSAHYENTVAITKEAPQILTVYNPDGS